jgi:hypothetical protein
MQTIETKYIPATSTRGRRVKATSTSGISVTVPWNDGVADEQNHHRAAAALAQTLGWTGRMVSGSLRRGGLVYVFLPVSHGSHEVVDLRRAAAGDVRRSSRRSRSSRRARR